MLVIKWNIRAGKFLYLNLCIRIHIVIDKWLWIFLPLIYWKKLIITTRFCTVQQIVVTHFSIQQRISPVVCFSQLVISWLPARGPIYSVKFQWYLVLLCYLVLSASWPSRMLGPGDAWRLGVGVRPFCKLQNVPYLEW